MEIHKPRLLRRRTLLAAAIASPIEGIVTRATGAPAGRDTHWVGAWATTPDPTRGFTLTGQTLRMITRLSLGGSRFRVRISNAYGGQPLLIGAAHVGLRSREAGLVPGSGRPLTFGGSPSAIVPPGALILSDPVDLSAPALGDLAVSLYLPGKLGEDFRLTGHSAALQTNYISPPGDFAAAQDLPVQAKTDAFLFVSGVEVLARRAAGCIVAFGDSLTEGNLSTPDSNNRWPDQLARRLAARRGGRQLGVVNLGIGGNRLLHDGRGDNALRRFDRDVLAQPGVTHAIVLIGINDLRNASHRADEVAAAPAMIAGLHQLAARGQAAGLKMFAGTLLPWENETFRGGSYSAEGEATRLAVNAWIRSSGAFDAVIDFEAMLRDPDHPTRILPRWDCGDHLHPNDAGYVKMGDGIDLKLFDQ